MSPNDIIWDTMAADLAGKVKPSTLYSNVINNRYNLLTMIRGSDNISNANDSTRSIELMSNGSGAPSSPESSPRTHHFAVKFTKEEFGELITTTSYHLNDVKGGRKREYTVLTPKKWTDVMGLKMYDATRFNHAFQFRSHFMHRDESQGTINGMIASLIYIYMQKFAHSFSVFH